MKVAVRLSLLAHCDRCGSFDLQRISRDVVQRWNSWFFRLARVPAYRCPPCRNRFFSVLPRRRLRPVESQEVSHPGVASSDQDPSGHWIR
jgi:hypothetical protein